MTTGLVHKKVVTHGEKGLSEDWNDIHEFTGNFDVEKHQPLNMALENRANFPAGPVQGQVIFRTDFHNAMVWNGTTWKSMTPAFLIVVAADGSGDYTDIQDGIDALPASGGIVHVKTETYTITAPITIGVDDTTLEGDFHGTLIETTTNAVNLIENAGHDRVVIRNLFLYGDGAGKDNEGINWVTCHEGTIENVYIQNCEGGGINMFGSEGNRILNNTIRDCWNYGLYFNGCDKNLITGNTILEILTDGFGIGMLFTGTYANTVKNNYVFQCEQEGIYIHNTDYNIYGGNMVLNNSHGNVNGHAGIYIAGGSEHNSIVGNHSFDDKGVHTQSYGIREAAVGDNWNLITNNVCVDNITAEVSSQGPNSITDNNITGP